MARPAARQERSPLTEAVVALAASQVTCVLWLFFGAIFGIPDGQDELAGVWFGEVAWWILHLFGCVENPNRRPAAAAACSHSRGCADGRCCCCCCCLGLARAVSWSGCTPATGRLRSATSSGSCSGLWCPSPTPSAQGGMCGMASVWCGHTTTRGRARTPRTDALTVHAGLRWSHLLRCSICSHFCIRFSSDALHG